MNWTVNLVRPVTLDANPSLSSGFRTTRLTTKRLFSSMRIIAIELSGVGSSSGCNGSSARNASAESANPAPRWPALSGNSVREIAAC